MNVTNRITALAASRGRFPRGGRWLFGLAFALCSAAAAGSPEVRQLTIGSSAGTDSTYSAGDRISVTVQFDATVDVTGTPVLQIDVGGTTRRAAMWMHGGSRVHFGYSVRAADDDPDGISIEAGAIKLAGGSIDGKDGAAAALSLRGHTIANAPEHKVDGAGAWPPNIVSVSVTSNPGVDATYSGGDQIEMTVEYDEQVFVEGLPTLRVDVGNESREAPYRRGSGSNQLTFTSRVWDGDLAAGGIVLPENGLAGGAGITDADGNIAQSSYPAPGRQTRHRVDGVGPQVVGLALVSTPPSGGVYGEGDMVEVEVTFNEEVYLTGRASMPVNGLPQVDGDQMGGGARVATAVESRERSILFRFSVLSQDTSQGVYFGRGPLARPAALTEQWPSIQDRAGNAASPLYADANTWHGASIDGSRSDTTPPAVHSVSIASRPLGGGTYRRGEALAVRVLFTEALQMPRGSWATTELLLETGAITLGAWIGRGATSAIFTHLITEADVDSDGVSLAGTVNVGPVQDAAGNRIEGESMEFTPFTDTDHQVNGKQATAARPRQVASGPTWTGGRLSFDGMVVVRGTPEFVLAGKRRATRFRPPQHSFVDKDRNLWHIDYGFPGVTEDDFDLDGVQLPAEGWPDVSFFDARGRAVAVDSIALPRSWGPAIGPTFHGVVLEPPAHGGNRYGEGQALAFHVVFAEPVHIAGAARLKVGVRELPCTPRNGRHRHFVCSRTIAAGENVTALELARGAFRMLAISIKDDDGETVDGDLSAYAETIAPFSVDTNLPRIRDVGIASNPAANGTYGAGAVVSIVVRFSEPVVATGSEQLAIQIGDSTRTASLEGNAGADGLRFTYVVTRGDTDANGLAISADAIQLEGGAITDLAGNPASLAHEAMGERSTHRVDGSTADLSTTPVQVQIATAPAATLGSPTQAAKASVTWQATSTWSRQPRMSYTVAADRPDVLVGRASGRVRLGQRITNNLRMPCKVGGTANVRLTISVKNTRAPVVWDVLCRDGVIRVKEVELFQGPLAGRFGPEGAAGHVDAIEHRQGALRVHVEHETPAAPDIAVGVAAPSGVEALPADHTGSGRSSGKWISRYIVPLAPAQVARGNGVDVVADPHTYFDATVETAPRMKFDALSPKTLPVFKPVIVPIEVQNAAPDVSAPALLKTARSLLPIARMSSRVRAPFAYDLSAAERSGKQVQTSRLFNSLAALANKEAKADEFYIGIALTPAGWQADSNNHRYGDRVQVVIDEADAPEMVAFGIGWGMGLRSVPCQPLGDPRFPHAGIGPEGSYSLIEQRIITPAENYYDLMSDCTPQHISIYNYQKAVVWGEEAAQAVRRNEPARLGVVSAAGVVTAAGNLRHGSVPSVGSNRLKNAPATPRSLALSGSVDEHGFWSLFASTTSTSPPRLDPPGNYILTLHDDTGTEMHRQPLATTAVGNASAPRSATWAARVPMQPREIHAIRIRNAVGSLLLDNNIHLPASPDSQAH